MQQYFPTVITPLPNLTIHGLALSPDTACPADMQQYFPAASPAAIDLLNRLLTFDPGGWVPGGSL